MKQHGRRALALVLTMLLLLGVLPVGALADESTTTIDSVYKDLSSHTEIWAVTTAPGKSYPAYGAKYEPQGGVLYGRTSLGGTLANGNFGLINGDEAANESIMGHYYTLKELLGDYSLEYWSYLYGVALADGQHAFIVYLNFDREGGDVSDVLAGVYDAKLRETFQYLGTMSHPVFLRIGGEMNVWNNAVTPQNFIAAYRHIADLARAVAPNVALVFSPNFSSAYKVDMDSFYPGDSYVDWIGASLYYLQSYGDGSEDMFRGRGDVYGDPMLNVQQIVNLAKLHNRPVMITEGGSPSKDGGKDLSAWAAERIQKAYAFLPMVYPQVKCIITSDYPSPNGVTDYTFYNNATVTSAIRSAVKAVGVYRDDWKGTGRYLTALSDSPDLNATPEGNVVFHAYTYSPTKLTATWTLDGQTVGTGSSYPYTVSLDRNQVLTGTHTLTVSFSNGQKISYGIVNGKVGAVPEMPSSWATADVNRASSLGLVPSSLMSGYTKTITRAEFCALGVKLYETVTGKEIAGRTKFSDTSDANVEKLASLGVVNGTGDGKFDPNGALNREQAAKLLALLSEQAGKKMPAGSLNFSDSTAISSWAVEYVRLACGSGINKGTDKGTFEPNQPYTREQGIITMLRLFEYVQG